jgi:hypothetical protein
MNNIVGFEICFNSIQNIFNKIVMFVNIRNSNPGLQKIYQKNL